MLRLALTLSLLAALFLDRAAAQDASAPPDTLRVLVWNAWRGGNEVDQGPEKVLAVIREADVDLVLMQESYDVDGERPTLGRWVAGELGWQAHQGDSPHLCVLSRRPLRTTWFHHPWHGLGVEVADEQGRAFVAWSIWLDWRAYLPEGLRDDAEATDGQLLARESEESSRLPQARELLAAVERVAAERTSLPTLVGGDFNTPSHLDWTVDTARIYRHRRALPLPVSGAMHAAGFVDTFRAVHPNPVQRPGLTWTPLFRSGSERGEQCFERIDRLYLRNPEAGWRLVPSAATTLPEVWEDDAVPVRQRRFPSDHGAVRIELRWVRGAAGGE